MPTERWKRLAFAFLLIAVASPVQAQIELRTAAQMGSDPKFIDAMVGHAHVVNGFCIDLHRAIERIEPSLHIVGDQEWQPSARIEEGLAEGHLDVACGLVRTPEREKHLLFVAPPLLTFNYLLTTRANDAVQVQNWNDVRKLEPDNVVLANHGWGYAHQLDDVPGLHVDTSAYSPEINLQKLVAGHGRFFYFREPGLSEAIHRAGLAGQVKVQPTTLSTTDVYMALRADLPAATVTMFEHAMQQLDTSGEVAKLAARWN